MNYRQLLTLYLLSFSIIGFSQTNTNETILDSNGLEINALNIYETFGAFDKSIEPYKNSPLENRAEIGTAIRNQIALKEVDNQHILLFMGIYQKNYQKDQSYTLANFFLTEKLHYGDSLNVNDYYKLGSNYFLMEQSDSALTYYNEVAKRTPEDDGVLNDIGWIHAELGNDSTAYSYFKKAYDIDPEPVANLNNYGYGLYLIGDLYNADMIIQKAKMMDDKNPFVYRNLGLIYMKKGRRKRACQNLDAALSLNIIERFGEHYISELKNYCESEEE